MVQGLTSCVTVKNYPTSTSFLSFQNPSGSIPKLIHITSDRASHARTTLGWILDAWFTPEHGIIVSTYTSGNSITTYFYPVSQTPTEVNTYYITASSIEFYKGDSATGNKWDTSTEYVAEIYSGPTYIYRIDNVPSGSAVDTGICLTDTDKSWTILVDAQFPKAYADSTYYYRNGNNQTPFVRSNSSVTCDSESLGFLVYNYYGRVYWMDKQSYTSNNQSKDFISTNPRRYASWHEAGSNVANGKFNNSSTITTPSAEFVANNTNVFIRASGSYIVINQLLIYDKMLSQTEIDNYISYGMIP